MILTELEKLANEVLAIAEDVCISRPMSPCVFENKVATLSEETIKLVASLKQAFHTENL